MQISLWKYQVTKHYKCMKENWLPTENDKGKKEKKRCCMLILWNAAWDIDAHLLHILASFCVVYACDRHRMGWTNWIHSNLTKEQGCLDIAKKNSKNCRDIILFTYWYILTMVYGVALSQNWKIYFFSMSTSIFKRYGYHLHI